MNPQWNLSELEQGRSDLSFLRKKDIETRSYAEVDSVGLASTEADSFQNSFSSFDSSLEEIRREEQEFLARKNFSELMKYEEIDVGVPALEFEIKDRLCSLYDSSSRKDDILFREQVFSYPLEAYEIIYLRICQLSFYFDKRRAPDFFKEKLRQMMAEAKKRKRISKISILHLLEQMESIERQLSIKTLRATFQGMMDEGGEGSIGIEEEGELIFERHPSYEKADWFHKAALLVEKKVDEEKEPITQDIGRGFAFFREKFVGTGAVKEIFGEIQRLGEGYSFSSLCEQTRRASRGEALQVVECQLTKTTFSESSLIMRNLRKLQERNEKLEIKTVSNAPPKGSFNPIKWIMFWIFPRILCPICQKEADEIELEMESMMKSLETLLSAPEDRMAIQICFQEHRKGTGFFSKISLGVLAYFVGNISSNLERFIRKGCFDYLMTPEGLFQSFSDFNGFLEKIKRPKEESERRRKELKGLQTLERAYREKKRNLSKELSFILMPGSYRVTQKILQSRVEEYLETLYAQIFQEGNSSIKNIFACLLREDCFPPSSLEREEILSNQMALMEFLEGVVYMLSQRKPKEEQVFLSKSTLIDQVYIFFRRHLQEGLLPNMFTGPFGKFFMERATSPFSEISIDLRSRRFMGKLDKLRGRYQYAFLFSRLQEDLRRKDFSQALRRFNDSKRFHSWMATKDLLKIAQKLENYRKASLSEDNLWISRQRREEILSDLGERRVLLYLNQGEKRVLLKIREELQKNDRSGKNSQELAAPHFQNLQLFLSRRLETLQKEYLPNLDLRVEKGLGDIYRELSQDFDLWEELQSSLQTLEVMYAVPGEWMKNSCIEMLNRFRLLVKQDL